MRKLRDALAECVQKTQWTDRQRTITSDDFRKLHDKQRLDDYSRLFFVNFRPETPDLYVAALARELRELLRRFVRPDTDRFGNGLAYLMGGLFAMREPTVPEFAKTLVKPATLLGSDRVAGLLLSWEQGEALHYQSCLLLEGITIDQPLKAPGLSLVPTQARLVHRSYQ